MKQYLENYELRILAELHSDSLSPRTLNSLLRHIQWLQHERLIHLIVTLFTAILFLIFATAFLWTGSYLGGYVFVILSVMTLFYIIHYARLENTVQKWYRVADELEFKLKLKEMRD